MNKKVLFGLLAVLLLGTGVLVYKVVSTPKQQPIVEEEPIETLPATDASILVDVAKSKVKGNTIVLSISGLGGTYSSVAYEISYDSQGVTQGVTSKPLDVAGKDSFVHDDIYLGTCSRNVCLPHPGVTSVSVILVFADASGQKSQFSKEYSL